MARKIVWICLVVICLAGIAPAAFAGANPTAYPVVFAHGSFGFDEIAGVYYFGDDYGTFVGKPCLSGGACNGYLNKAQKAYATKVWAFQSSEERGLWLSEQIEGIMLAAGKDHVNIIGHSQGGVDARKAATLLSEVKGYPVVKVLASISSNHRGCPLGKSGMDLDEDHPLLSNLFEMVLENFYGDIILDTPGNDLYAMFKGVMYDDYDPADGKLTGVKAFNDNWPIDPDAASLYISFITAQNGLSRNPLLAVFTAITGEIDGDGYCVGDCDGDGAAGKGDGNPYDLDDDGLVGINSQQMGYRMKYVNMPFFFDWVQVDTGVTYAGDLNNPTQAQMTSSRSLMDADHFDPIFIGPDLFDEMEFYAAIIDYMAKNGG
jgi:triacylglycerol lipase